MNSYKIHNVRTDRFGNNEPHFSGADGKLFRLAFVGSVWKQETHPQLGAGWAKGDMVVNSKAFGLLRFSSFKSRTTKPMILADGEVYLPLEKTGRAMRLESLPE